MLRSREADMARRAPIREGVTRERLPRPVVKFLVMTACIVFAMCSNRHKRRRYTRLRFLFFLFLKGITLCPQGAAVA